MPSIQTMRARAIGRAQSLVLRLASDSLYRNGVAIMAASVVTAALGYFYWIIVAHAFSALEVGIITTLISVMLLCALVANLGVGSTLVQMLPRRASGQEWSAALNAGVVVGALAGMLAGLIAGVILWLASQQLGLHQGAVYAIALALSIPVWTVVALLDQVYVAERAAHHMVIRGGTYAILKIALSIVVWAIGWRSPVVLFLVWPFSAGISATLGCLFLVPRLRRDYCLAFSGLGAQVRAMMSSLVGNHLINLGGALPGYILPVLVTIRLGATDTAYFYTVSKVGDFLFMPSSAVSTSLFAEGSRSKRQFNLKTRRSIIFVGCLYIPAVLLCWLGGHYILLVFGSTYALNGVILLRIDSFGYLPDAVTNVYVSVLRVRHKLMLAAALNLAMVGLTIILAWILLPGLGIAGAGWAFLLGEGAGAVVGLADYLVQKRRPTATRPQSLRTTPTTTLASHESYSPTTTDLAPQATSAGEPLARRVCVVGAGTQFLGGVSYYTWHMSNALAASDQVSVILMRKLLPKFLFPGRQRVGAPLMRLRYDPRVRVFDGIDWYWGTSIIRALAFLRHERPNVVILQWWTGTVLHSYLVLALAARLLGAQLVIEFHEVLDPGEATLPMVRGYVRRIAPLVIRCARRYVVHSRGDAVMLASHYHLDNQAIAIVPHGPYDQYRTDQSAPHLSRDAHAASRMPAAINLLFFGLIRPYKGLEDLIRAFGTLDADEIDRYRLTVVGETWEGWTLPAQLIAASRYRDRIVFINRYVSDDEVSATFAAADAVVLPYRRASASGALQIALACGLPVIISRVEGLVEGAAGYAGQIVVEPGDIQGLRDALRVVPSMCGVRYANPYSWEQAVLRYHHLFESLVSDEVNTPARRSRRHLGGLPPTERQAATR